MPAVLSGITSNADETRHHENTTTMTDRNTTLGCDDALEIASASFDGEASLEEIDRLASHLTGCATCRAAVAELEKDDARLRQLRPVGAEDTVRPRPAAPRAHPAKRPAGRHSAPSRSPRRWLPAALAAAAVVAIVLLRPVDGPRPVDSTDSVDSADPGGSADLADVVEPERQDRSLLGDGLPDRVAQGPESTDLDRLAAELEQRSSQAETLLAQRQRSNPFRAQRSTNPFRDRTQERSPGPDLRPFEGPHPFRSSSASNRSRRRL